MCIRDRAGRGRAQAAGGVHPESWGSQRGGGRAGGRLKPGVMVTIGGDRPPRLCGDVTFEDMREIFVAYLEYEQQMHVADEDGGDRVLARRQELVDSATPMMVADEFYDYKPWIYLAVHELKKGLETFVGLVVQQTSVVEFCHQIFRVLKVCLLYTSPSPRDLSTSRMPSSA